MAALAMSLLQLTADGSPPALQQDMLTDVPAVQLHICNYMILILIN